MSISNTKLMCNLIFTRFSITKTSYLSINLSEVRELWISIKLITYLMKKKI